MFVSSGGDPPPGTPQGDPGVYQQHEKTIPGASAELTEEEHDYLYQEQKVYDDDMMDTILNKFTTTDTDMFANTTHHQATTVFFHIHEMAQQLVDGDDGDNPNQQQLLRRQFLFEIM